MKEILIIIGAGGHGKVCADIAELMECYKEIYFLDDNVIGSCLKHEIIGQIKDFKKFINIADYFIAIGDGKTREKIFDEIEKSNLEIVSLIHPSAVIASSAKIGKGTVVAAGAVINPDSNIGKGCIINTSSSIDHDVIIKDFSHIAPGAHLAGAVFVDKYTWVGVGSIVKNNITITSECMVGAGAVVVCDIKESGTYVGIPAKKIK